MTVDELIHELRKIAVGESGLGAGYTVYHSAEDNNTVVEYVDVDHETKEVWLC